MKTDGVIALIPAWNEGTRLEPVVRETRTYLPVLVVDDGSEDETASIAESAGATVIRHATNQGKGVALVNGFKWCWDHGYEAALTLDADGQHDPHDIPKFLAAYEAGAGDLIIGRRDFSKMPFPRGHTNPFGSWLLSKAIGAPIHDNQSGYRLYTRSLIERVNLTASGFELEVEVIAEAVRQGIPIGWVDIETIYGIGKRSNFHPITDTVRFLQMVWRVYREQRRRRIVQPTTRSPRT